MKERKMEMVNFIKKVGERESMNGVSHPFAY